MAPHRDAFFAALADDFNTPRALGALFEWIREANRRDGAGRARGPREMLGVLGLENLPSAGDEAGAEELELLERRAGGARGEGLRRGRPRCATSSPRAAGTVRDGPDGAELVRIGRDPLRPQPRARGAARRPAADRGGLGDRARARASRGCARRPTSSSPTPTSSTRRCGSPDHQGVCAEAGGYPYAGAAELLAATDPLIVALDEVQDPQNLGAIAARAECAGRDRAS